MNSPIGFILGTGWDGIVKDVKNKKETSFEKIFKRKTTAIGHKGIVIKGYLQEKEVILLSGRFHTYEGYSSHEATETVRYLHMEGVKKIIITSAVGALNPKYQVGDLVILHDLITLFCQSPLSGPQFQNMSEPFSRLLVESAVRSCTRVEIPFQKGVHVYFRGPHFETFADKMALRFLGADVCGMSMAPEVIMANHLNMEVLGLSLVTNLAFVKHDAEEVLAQARSQEKNLRKFFLEFMKII